MGFLDRLKTMMGPSRVDVNARFALLREAISGTMSKFYMARDLKTNKIVGLKILDIDRTTALEARFRGLNKPSEGEIGMKLKHPRIVETYEYGVTTQGNPYIMMEFIDGPDFNSLIIGNDPSLDGKRLRFIRQAAEALGVVHAAGFTHRDVCPRNLLLMRKGGDDLKLIDFGVTLPTLPQFQQPGVRTGVPNYMAPEIVRRKPTDVRVDLFAFGASAYEICAGSLPWIRGSTGMAAMSHDKPPIPLTKLRPQVNPVLAKAIHWCIEAEPSKRCPSVEKFLQAIRDVKHEDAK